jgi:hypothetical protein
MQARSVRVAVFVALALVLNHARCVAACITAPCTQSQQQSCHHHQAPDARADRGCAFPATNGAPGAAAAPDATVALQSVVVTYLAIPTEAPDVVERWLGGPPGLSSISVLRI